MADEESIETEASPTSQAAMLQYGADRALPPVLPGWVVLLNLPLIGVGLAPTNPNAHWAFDESLIALAVAPLMHPLSFLRSPTMFEGSIQLFYATALLPVVNLFLQWHLYRPRRLGALRLVSLCLLALSCAWIPLLAFVTLRDGFLSARQLNVLWLPFGILLAVVVVIVRRWRDPLKDYAPAILATGCYLAGMSFIAALSFVESTISDWMRWGAIVAVVISVVQLARLSQARVSRSFTD